MTDRQPGSVYAWKLLIIQSNVGYWVKPRSAGSGLRRHARSQRARNRRRDAKIGDCVSRGIPVDRHAALIKQEEDTPALVPTLSIPISSNSAKTRGVTVKVIDGANTDPALLPTNGCSFLRLAWPPNRNTIVHCVTVTAVSRQ